MSDLTMKEIKGKFDNRNHTKEQIRKYKRYGKEFINNLTGIYMREDLAVPIIMDCRKLTAVEFRSKILFKKHDIILKKGPSVSTRIMKAFTSEKYYSSIMF